jgi:hypothetical protein
VQFLLRLSFGLAVSMAIVPPQTVSSGFYRVHLWVLMGVNTLAALVTISGRATLTGAIVSWPLLLGLAVVTAASCYVGSVAWLFERRRLGTRILRGVALTSLLGALAATAWGSPPAGPGILLTVLDVISGGVLLGSALAAMLLGHWYLNSPTMDLAPLKRLVAFLGCAIAARVIICGVGLGLEATTNQGLSATEWTFVAFRWLAGLVGTATMAWMAWRTLRVPNTQSATGILYTGVVLVLLGELVSQLLSVDLAYPL